MGCNNIEIRKSESVAKSQFLYTKLGEFCSLRGLVEEAGERRKGGGRGRRRKEREGKKKERKGKG